MSESKVVSLRGEPVHTPGVPVESVVSLLEDALAAAKRGDIQGVVLIEQGGERYGHSIVGSLCRAHTIAELDVVRFRLVGDELADRS